jgi:hypothetical protein
MGLHNLFHFNNEVTVIGSLSYYPYLDVHFFYTKIEIASKNFLIQSFIIHGNRSPLLWFLEF